MMALPFLSFALAFWLGSKNRKKSAIIAFVVSIVLIVVLAKYHITDPLNLQF
ncbi:MULTISPECIES: DUF5993 family protein [Chryseobacterium]|uniref:DUF5993 family protein n=1 Tax=Chryseobacterium TaxID=59732 RepID=UPI000A58689A|nr:MULTISPECIES: DUF5993 family protein [Chryseobacterium]MCL8538072.1 DUF5993 family protein [Chryseobacterium gallinarum]